MNKQRCWNGFMNMSHFHHINYCLSQISKWRLFLATSQEQSPHILISLPTYISILQNTFSSNNFGWKNHSLILLLDSQKPLPLEDISQESKFLAFRSFIAVPAGFFCKLVKQKLAFLKTLKQENWAIGTNSCLNFSKVLLRWLSLMVFSVQLKRWFL